MYKSRIDHKLHQRASGFLERPGQPPWVPQVLLPKVGEDLSFLNLPKCTSSVLIQDGWRFTIFALTKSTNRLRAPSYFVNTETPEVTFNLILFFELILLILILIIIFTLIIFLSHNPDNNILQGLMLHYRSKRRGFTTYTAGQLKAVAQTYFKTEMGIEVKMMVILVMLVVGGSPQRVKTKFFFPSKLRLLWSKCQSLPLP